MLQKTIEDRRDGSKEREEKAEEVLLNTCVKAQRTRE